jgi:hypothetical protein
VRAFLTSLFLLAACDSEPPQISAFTPVDGEDLRGIRFVSVTADYTDESSTKARLYADGHEVARPQPDCVDEACTIDTKWDTTDLEVGTHELMLEVEDDAGNVAREKHQVVVDDVLEIVSLRVDNVTDASGTLEIEVYAFDDATNELLGCAGSRQGLDGVDYAGRTYALDAILIRPDQALLATGDFGDRRVRLEVWEDDDAPTCPVVPDALGNNFIGASEPHTTTEWRDTQVATFNQVPDLEVRWSRRLSTGEDPNPGSDGDDYTGFGGTGAGCSTTGQGSPWLVLAVAFVLRRRLRTRA